ncbi:MULTISPECIES: hypothetical protein [Mammaliicoccus]|uniref:hypothetical protein n=1 Tax=Mammaliicoccus TaxID=2803850 RepID=UPI001AAC7679|nr:MULTISPECIES: hypothetical protein [Mammaliicoccus]MBO3062934.1 hypothetical protein [Mammaliicoccus fleurettii]MEB7408028.1 hypothetical protein [Mammaliicoccus sciuri]
MNKFDNPEHYEELTDCKKEALLDFCNSFEKVKGFNLHNSSYGLKHIFENLYRKELHGEQFGSSISNGQFKGAMLKSGFEVKDKQAKNWNFNISKRSIKEIKLRSE